MVHTRLREVGTKKKALLRVGPFLPGVPCGFYTMPPIRRRPTGKPYQAPILSAITIMARRGAPVNRFVEKSFQKVLTVAVSDLADRRD